MTRPTPLPVIVDGIPDALKREDRWVAWKYEWREPANGKSGQWTKPPYVATATERDASSTDPRTWRSFADALCAYEDGKCDGIGFVLGDGWTGFDSDHQDAPEYVRLLNTYTEYSPSGDGGVHALCRGAKPGPKCRTGDYELYDAGRYLTVTGHHLAGTPTTVEERTAEVAALYARLFPNGSSPKPSASSSNDLTDDALISKASTSKSGPKFAALWRGDITGYQSHSEADFALCSMLAFWTNRDSARMDRLFRRSGLYREKWDRLSADQIAKAITSTPKGYEVGSQPTVTFIRASEVKVEKIEWLWQARLALGAITLVEGGPERGKSTILVDIAARVSRGHSFPGETETRDPANVVMLIAEDDVAATVVPRLIAAGADLSRVFFLSVTRDADGDIVPFHLSDDCERLRLKCLEVGGVALVIVDPLVSFLGSRRGRALNTYNDLEVRKALAPLKELAEHLHATVAAIRHYRKNTGTNAMEAGGGSVAFAALVRVIIAALPDPEDESRYLLAVAKNNLVVKSKRPALAYGIVPSDTDPDIGRIAWGDAVEMSANEIFAAQAEADKNSSGKVGEAKEFLERLLASGEWMATTEILKAADANGLSKRAVQRAKDATTVVAEKQGKHWGWRLPPPPKADM